MRKRPPGQSSANRIRRSRNLRRIAAITATFTVLVAGAGTMTPAQAVDGPEQLNKTYDRVKAALENAQKPGSNPLEGLMPAAGGPLDQSISELESDLKDFMPGGKLPEANPNDPNLINQNPKSINNEQLNITVAKSMLVTTSAAGDPAMNVLLSNTQVSGNGSATVKVPVATTNAKNSSGFQAPAMEGQDIVYNVNNSAGTVQTLAASNGSYKGKLPIKVDVETWLDGKKIDPADMVNVTGKVKLVYTFRNVTGEKTKISFKGPDGALITQEKEIPIPFGGAFSITLPSQFADINAPWAEGGVSPSGTTLSGTVMLIPPLGAVTQSVAIEARADAASLPGATFQALPVTLTDQGMGRLAYQALPLGGDVTNVALQAGAFGKSDLVKLHALVQKYAAVAAGISNNYVKPVVQAFKDGEVDAAIADAEAQLVKLDQGAEQLGQLLPTATKVITYVDDALNFIVPAFENNTANINKIIGYVQTASTLLNKYLPKIQQAVIYFEQNLPALIEKGAKLTESAGSVCKTVDNFMDGHSIHTIDEMFSWAIPVVKAFSATYGQYLENIQTAIDELYANKGYVVDCVAYATIVEAMLLALNAQMPTIIANLNKFEADANKVAGYLDQAAEYGDEFEALEPTITKALDNNNCPKTPSGISNCGIMQQIDYLVSLMNQATTAVNGSMVPGLNSVVRYIPAANKFIGLADTYVPIFGEKIERMIPEVFQGADTALDAGDSALAGYTSKADKAAVLVASYTAQLEVMNARAQSGQGIPAGPAQGANTNLGVYQYQIAGADNQKDPTLIMFGLAGILILLSAAVGTVLYSKNKT